MPDGYIPLTQRSSGSSENDDWTIHPTSRRNINLSRLPLPRAKIILALIGVVTILMAYSGFQYINNPSSESQSLIETPELLPEDQVIINENPYFHTGHIWDHNDKIASKLKRCSELGLLRNTSLPNSLHSHLPSEEEIHYQSEGCGINETTIIILSSIYFSEAYQEGSEYSNAGESIYAQSIISTLNRWGYSYMFSSLGWYNHDMSKTIEIFNEWRWNVRIVLADPEQIKSCWYDQKGRCLKEKGFQEGIEPWRLLGFWYWDDIGNPLGPSFTLSPSPRNQNYFLSYSIEPTCNRLPTLSSADRAHPPQAYLLAKHLHFLDDTPAFSWSLDAFKRIMKNVNIKIVGGMRNELGEDKEKGRELAKEVKNAGIRNYGKLGKMEFYDQIRRSFVLLGVGQPRISPSPWDALCMGVPWDEADPWDRSKWTQQQWHMTDLDPPYVYHVHAHDLPALEKTIKKALDHPIDSWIPDYMKFDYVCDKMAEVVERDWLFDARRILEDRIETGEGELFEL